MSTSKAAATAQATAPAIPEEAAPAAPNTLEMFPEDAAAALSPDARVTVLLEVDGLDVNGIQMREGLDEDTVATYAARMQAIAAQDERADVGEPPFPALKGYVEDLRPWAAYAAAEGKRKRTMPDPRAVILVDGFHRLEAARRIDRLLISVELRQGSRRQALLYACGANIHHGRPATPADCKKAARALLNDAECRTWADREIARQTGASARTVGRLRAEMGAKAEARRYVRQGVEQVHHLREHGEQGDGCDDLFEVVDVMITCEHPDILGRRLPPADGPTCGSAAGEPPEAAPSPAPVNGMGAPRVYPAIIPAEEALPPHLRHLLRRWAYTHGYNKAPARVAWLAELPEDLDRCEDGRGFEDLDSRLVQLTEGDDAPLERLESGQIVLRLGLTAEYAGADDRFAGTYGRENEWARRRVEQLAREMGVKHPEAACDLDRPGHGPRIIRIRLSGIDGAYIWVGNSPTSRERGAEWAASVEAIEEAVVQMRAALASSGRQ